MIQNTIPGLEIDNYLTPVQAAKVLHVSLATLKKFIYTGRLRTLKTPGGHHRIFRPDLFALLEENISDRTLVCPENKTSLAIAAGLVAALEQEHPFCQGHARKVAQLSLRIAGRLRLGQAQQKTLQAAALLHDIGMLDIDRSVLEKKQRLTTKEIALIKTHPALGARIAQTINAIRPMSRIILHHHERYDGAGYPQGLKADNICIEARIISLSEAYVAMTTHPGYKPVLPEQKAIAQIKANAGRQFAPEAVDAFLSIYHNSRRAGKGAQHEPATYA